MILKLKPRFSSGVFGLSQVYSEIVKKRLASLDGLRGFAALSVVLSHAGFNPQAIIDSPVANYVFRIFSAGTYSVQILFVLSGFLMAYLYPVVTDTVSFLAKRYLRIMPIYAVIVWYLWLSRLGFVSQWWQHALLLVGLAVAVHAAWRLLHQLQERWQWLGKVLLGGFLGFQTLYLGFSLFVLPVILQRPDLSVEWRELFTMLANLTHTTYFNRPPLVMSGVFWSLSAEIAFYVLYPFVVVPALVMVKRWGWVVATLLTLASLKIILDLDTASLAIMSVQGMFLSRATGFVVGVCLGTWYLSQGKSWQKAEQLLSHPVVNLILFGVLAFSLAFEWPDRFHQIRPYVSLHYLGLSVLFGVIIAAAISQKSLLYRFFSAKWLTFLGLISYSLYLIHSEVIHLLHLEFSKMFGLSANEVMLLGLVASVVCSVIVSWGLFKIVEALYFWSRKPSFKTQAKIVPSFQPRPLIVIAMGLVLSGILVAWYAGSYSPTLMVHKQSLSKPWGSELLVTEKYPVELDFQSDQPQLSAVFLTMFYARDPQTVRTALTEQVSLKFELFDAAGQRLFESSRSPLLVEGTPHFPFGFPTLLDSQGKSYKIRLSLMQADPSDQLFIQDSAGLVTQYTTEKTRSWDYFAQLLSYRLQFAASHVELWFALAVVWAVVAATYTRDKQDKTA